MSPKVKTTKGEGVRAWSLVRSISEVEVRAGVLGWGLGRLTNKSNTHTNQTNQTTSWLMCNYNTFCARTSHEQTRPHKTHHGPNLGEATTFPFILFYVFDHKASTQMSFCLRSPEIPKIETPATLEAHNFMCKPLIEVRS
jgi:hypothetical protein